MRVNYDNATTSALTLNVNNTGAKTLFINGDSTPDTDFTSGTYIGYYNTYWQFYSLIPTASASDTSYLLCSSSRLNTTKFGTNSNCYLKDNHLYSYGRRVLEFIGAST